MSAWSPDEQSFKFSNLVWWCVVLDDAESGTDPISSAQFFASLHCEYNVPWWCPHQIVKYVMPYPHFMSSNFGVQKHLLSHTWMRDYKEGLHYWSFVNTSGLGNKECKDEEMAQILHFVMVMVIILKLDDLKTDCTVVSG